MKRLNAYRVYFSDSPGTYYVVSAGRVATAVRRARKVRPVVCVGCGWRRKARARVIKVERLQRGGVVRELKHV